MVTRILRKVRSVNTHQGQRSYFKSSGADKWLKVVGQKTLFLVTLYNFKKSGRAIALPAPTPPPPSAVPAQMMSGKYKSSFSIFCTNPPTTKLFIVTSWRQRCVCVGWRGGGEGGHLGSPIVVHKRSRLWHVSNFWKVILFITTILF